jgi:hypothetical protein
MDGNGDTDHKYKVSFGEDTSGNKSIYISQYSDGKNGTDQTDSSLWRYPKVSVSNVFCGHASVPYSEWIDGWDVGVVTSSDIDTVYANHVVSRSLKLYESSYDLASLTINSAFTLPTADGSSDQVLLTNGAGVVTWADALMDSELTDLEGIKGVTISTLQVKPLEGAFADGDKTKLDAIEDSATADQTDAEIRTAIEAATDSNVFTDADHDKLDAQVPFIGTVNGRLSLKEINALPSGDQTAKTTIYFVPYKGNQIALYSGSAWVIHSFSALSLSLSGYAADTNFDIFIYDNSGTLTLESAAWTDDTTRATALTTQDGVNVKSGATTRRYLGTIRTTSTTGQCEDSVNSRFVWNHYNQVKRYLRSGAVTTGGHTYSTAAFRAWNSNTTVGQARHNYVLGLGSIVNANGSGQVRHGFVDYAIDSTTTGATTHVFNGSPDFDMTLNATADLNVVAGYHFAQGVQYGVASTSLFHSIYINTHFQG